MEGFIVFILLLQVFLIAHGCEVEAYDEIQRNLEEQQQSYRTGYHFQPPKNWMNDPNGPVYYKGVYHLFYQYNPYSAEWGNITWAHSVSQNLVDWIHLEHALNPTDPYDFNGCWSGSVTMLPGEIPTILYTGGDLKNQQVQNLAVPKNLSDPYLREWEKSNQNPLLTPGNDIEPNFFRDPTTAWLGQDKQWRVVIGSQINGYGTALLYRSTDFLKWTRAQSPLHFSNKTGMWECPDFFPVSIYGKNGLDTSVQGEAIKHVLKASFNNHDYYIIGAYDSNTDNFVVDTDFMDDNMKLRYRYDYGVFYASKTFYDGANKRRILWGWVTETDAKSDDIKRGWSGLQSFPRSIWLDRTGKQLLQWPITEIEKLRSKEVNLQNKEIKGGTTFEIKGITASEADVEVSFHLPNLDDAEFLDSEILDPQLLCNKNNASTGGIIGPFGLLVLASKNLTEYTAIYFRIYKSHGDYVVLMCSDQSRSSLAIQVDKTNFGAFVDIDPRENISLRSLIDNSIVESFGGEGKACMTARVYPKVAIDDDSSYLYAFNYGKESVTIKNLSAWSMKRAQIFPFHQRRKHQID